MMRRKITFLRQLAENPVMEEGWAAREMLGRYLANEKQPEPIAKCDNANRG